MEADDLCCDACKDLLKEKEEIHFTYGTFKTTVQNYLFLFCVCLSLLFIFLSLPLCFSSRYASGRLVDQNQGDVRSASSAALVGREPSQSDSRSR